MMELLKKNQEQLVRLCKRFEVRRLDLFGSAARGEFDTATSDLDFLVLFQHDGILNAADQYLGLLMALEDSAARSIWLIWMARGILIS
jgi:predicted nucleotidyltransferase